MNRIVVRFERHQSSYFVDLHKTSPVCHHEECVNYLPNVLSKIEAEEQGAFAAIRLDNDGFVAEGPNINVAFITKEQELLMPKFEQILTLTVREGKLRGIRVDNVSVDEA
ncbi:hypothetical protein V6N13_045781 [Hibiscus sabdariffa]